MYAARGNMDHEERKAIHETDLGQDPFGNEVARPKSVRMAFYEVGPGAVAFGRDRKAVLNEKSLDRRGTDFVVQFFEFAQDALKASFVFARKLEDQFLDIYLSARAAAGFGVPPLLFA